MMIALAAVGFKNGDIAYNKEKIKTVIRDHGNKQVDLILFGETFLQGFDSLSWNYDIDKSIAVKMNDPVIDEIREADFTHSCLKVRNSLSVYAGISGMTKMLNR
jgi:N-carbamoylputrescine amidase